MGNWYNVYTVCGTNFVYIVSFFLNNWSLFKIEHHHNPSTPLLQPLLLVTDWLYWPYWPCFYKKRKCFVHKMLFTKLQTHVFKSTFFSCNTFLYLWLSVWADICIINIWRKRGNRTFPKVSNLVVHVKFPMVLKFYLFPMKNIF